MLSSRFFFFHDAAPTEIYTLSLHDALPISLHETDFRRRINARQPVLHQRLQRLCGSASLPVFAQHYKRHGHFAQVRSEEHTSELQSQSNLVCRLLLEKKKTTIHPTDSTIDP